MEVILFVIILCVCWAATAAIKRAIRGPQAPSEGGQLAKALAGKALEAWLKGRK